MLCFSVVELSTHHFIGNEYLQIFEPLINAVAPPKNLLNDKPDNYISYTSKLSVIIMF